MATLQGVNGGEMLSDCVHYPAYKQKFVTWEQRKPRVMSADQGYRLVHRKFIVALLVYRKQIYVKNRKDSNKPVCVFNRY